MVWFEVINMETTRTIGSIIRSNPKTTAGLVVLWSCGRYIKYIDDELGDYRYCRVKSNWGVLQGTPLRDRALRLPGNPSGSRCRRSRSQMVKW